LSRLVTVVAITVALALAAALAPAAASANDDCAATDPLCFDRLPRDDTWERAIGLPAVSDYFEGDGVAVASIDTGVTPYNRDLGSRLLARLDFTADQDGIDRFGHGTHIAGLIASNGYNSEGAYEGAAPETDLVSLKVAGWDGATDVTTVIAALQWAASNGAKYGIRVVNLSWGTDGIQPTDVDPLNAAVERAWKANLVVVVAAGNTGPGVVTKPGDDPHVITVGAADIAGTAANDDDTVAAFSAHGTANGAGPKPDVLAPGVSLISDRARGSTIDLFTPSARVGWSLFRGSGTSQAAAVVSGVVARMLDANPELTPDQVKAALMRSTAGRLAGEGGGAGLIDAAAAVGMVSPRRGPGPLPSLDGPTPVDSSGTGTLEGARGAFAVSGDLDGDGAAESLSGELDALGVPWVSEEFMAPWTADSWALSPWAPLVAEIPGSAPVPAATGPVAPRLAWDPEYWGARSPQEAGWDARYWGARYWGARYWGTDSWR
jgi:serine protease AprX